MPRSLNGLTIACQGDTLGGISQEITQSLLRTPQMLCRRDSSNTTPPHSQLLDGSNCAVEDADPAGTTSKPRTIQSTGAWTTLNGEAWSSQDEMDDREDFIQEYNRLATKHKVRLLISDNYNTDSSGLSAKSTTWLARILRRTSSTHSTRLKVEIPLKHKRSISDVSLRRKSRTKNTLKDKDLQELVRLCGLSLLYLPTEYAPCSLAVPTCFRATAQYLVQHGSTAPGVFRIPGSNNIVATLYNHYCASDEEGVIAGTVRCPTLPQHIKFDVHDVASTFKRFLSCVPGGILGSLALFDAFVSIQNQLHTDPEVSTKAQSQIRSRLIALAVATLKSQYRRELICTVFGLLSLIGHTTETGCKGDKPGGPLPTSDLMTYGPLGIVFGPLLIGDLLDSYNLRLAKPHGGLVILPVSPPKSRKEKQKERRKSAASSHDALCFTAHVDKIKVVNSITEMLITHWREVVVHMKACHALRIVRRQRSLAKRASKRPSLRPSASESFAPRLVPSWNNGYDDVSEGNQSDRSSVEHNGPLLAGQKRSKALPISGKRLSDTKAISTLCPTLEGQEREICVAQEPSYMPSHTLGAQEVPLDNNVHYSSTKSPSTANSNQDDNIHKLYESVPKIRNSPRQKQKRALRLSRKSSAQSLLGNYVQEYEELLSSLTEPCSPNISVCAARPRGTEHASLYGTTTHDPGRHPGDPEPLCMLTPQHLHSSMELSSIRAKSKLIRTIGGPTDPLANLSPQEDLASLAALARVLSQESVDNEAKLQERLIPDVEKGNSSSGIATPPRQFISRRKGSCSSTSSSMPKFFSKRKIPLSRSDECSGSSSSPLPNVFSRRKGAVCKHTSSNAAPSKCPAPRTSSSEMSETQNSMNHPTKYISNGLSTTELSKTIVHHGCRTVQNNPRGTVKALVAKFSLGYSSSPVARSATKGPAADSRINIDSPKGSIVSPYTRNPPSPARSQKSGVSDKPAKAIRIPLNVDLHFTSPEKCSPIRTSMSHQQLRSCIDTAPNPHMTRRSLEGLAAPAEERSRYHGAILAPSLEVLEAVDGLNPTQLDSLHAHSIFSNPDLPARPDIQNLQRQLAAKTEEVRQLRQQIRGRCNLEAGTSAENGMETRREIQFWKSRAELFEKQLEMLRKTSGRSSSGQSGDLPTKAAERSDRSSLIYSGGGDIVADKNRRVLPGVYGAASSDKLISETGNRRCLYDFQDIVTSSETGNWVEQMISALRTADS